jgi:hypothetical protein
MDSSYRETKKKGLWQRGSGNVKLQSCPSMYLPRERRHILIVGIKCETPVTIVTQVMKLQVTQEMHNYRVIRTFSNVNVIPEIRTCRRAFSKYTLRQLCNYIFPDPRCHILFFLVSLYDESIPKVLSLSFDTPCMFRPYASCQTCKNRYAVS